MKEIKVLELFNLRSELPSSLQALVNLRTLCLHCCNLYGDLSVIGSQKELEILSFYRSSLEHFPYNISKLRNLKSLDLRFEGPPLPSGILSGLQKLEELFLGYYFRVLQSEGEDSVIITEICSLLNLQTLQLDASVFEKPTEVFPPPPLNPCVIHFLEQFLEKLHAEKLIKFEITNGGSVGKYQLGKVVILKRINVDLLKRRAAKSLLSKAEDLNLEVKGLTNLVGELDRKGFANLMRLNLESCDLQFLVDATSFRTNGGGAFINLEELFIGEAKNLEQLCHGNLPLGSFAKLREVRLRRLPALKQLWEAIENPSLENLRILEIIHCVSLRSLFPKSSLKCTPQVQEIENEDYPELEEVVSNKEEDEKEYVEFPILESLSLHYVNTFRSFGPESDSGALFEKVMLPNLDRLEISWIYGIRCIVDGRMPIGSLSKLQTISIRRCDDLVRVAASSYSIKLLKSLKHLEVKLCGAVEVVFDFTCPNEGAASLENPLAGLESLRLLDLPKLKDIWRMLPEENHVFRNLRSLYLISCPSLRYLLTLSVAEMLVGLETLDLINCEQMESVIGVDERKIVEIEPEENRVKNKKKIDGEEKTTKILFPKLKRIEVKRLENLEMFCSANADLELPSLTELEISRCPKMTNFFVKWLNNVEYDEESVALDNYGSWLKQVKTPNLETLKIINMNEISCVVDGQMPIGSLSKLRTMSVRNCHGLVHVIASGDANKLLQCLQQLEVEQCESLEVVFDFRGLNVKGAESLESPLARLESVKLYWLPQLKQIWRMLPEGIHAFKNLKSLSFFHCDSLRYLLSPSMAKLLVCLETLDCKDCELIEAVIGLGERDTTEKKKDGEEKSTNRIVFPKLRCLKVKCLDNFRMLCSVNVDLELPSLTEFVIEDCSKMTKFCPGRLSASRLTIINYLSYYDKTVSLDEFVSWLKDCESRIRCLECSYSGEEACSHLD